LSQKQFALCPTSENYMLFIIKVGSQCSYPQETKIIFNKLQKTKHNMKQFINRNNAYGSKVVSHTITNSLIIPGSSMA
jgi:hypothetical protein